MPFLCFQTILLDNAYIIFQNSVNNFEILHKAMLNFAEGVRIAQFNLAAPDGNSPEVRTLTAYVLRNLKTKPI